MGEFYARTEDAVRDFLGVIEAGANIDNIANRDLIDRALRFFHSVQRGTDSERYFQRAAKHFRQYGQRKEQLIHYGLCVVCGSGPAEKGKTMCSFCLEEKKRINRQLRGDAKAYQEREKEAAACMSS